MRVLRSIALVSLGLVAACAQGSGTVVLDVTANPTLDNVTTFDGEVTVGRKSVAIKLTLKSAPVAIPPTRTVAIVVPLSLGDKLNVHLNARDVDGALLGSADGSIDVVAGKRVDLALTLSQSFGDMGMPMDAGVDSGFGDGGCDGGVCPPDLCSLGGCFVQNGTACSASGPPCASGNCVDGFCCGVAGCGICQACTGAGGLCENQLGAGNQCGGAMTCDGKGNCVNLGAPGATCVNPTDCANGQCVDGHCCGSASCPLCNACTGANGTCIPKAPGSACTDGSGDTMCNGSGQCKKAIATSCATASDCFNGLCFDNVCCSTSCGGQCQACNSTPGTCTQVNGKPVTTTNTVRSDCVGFGTSCYGTCSPSGGMIGCFYPGSATSCTVMCQPGFSGSPAVTQPMGCSGNGSCSTPTGGATPCPGGTTQCTGNACSTNCSTDSGCINADYCSTKLASGIPGSCQPRHGNGFTCTTPDCESGACRFCSSVAACQPSGQCCQAGCSAPTCVFTGGFEQLQQYTCDTSGTCSSAIVDCQCVNNPSSQCQPCTLDSDCQRSHYYCNSQNLCVAQTITGGTCDGSKCSAADGVNCTQCQGGANGKACPVGLTCP